MFDLQVKSTLPRPCGNCKMDKISHFKSELESAEIMSKSEKWILTEMESDNDGPFSLIWS